jgi:Biotin-lipoyl like
VERSLLWKQLYRRLYPQAGSSRNTRTGLVGRSGCVRSIRVQDGQAVKVGDLLIELDRSDQRLEFRHHYLGSNRISNETILVGGMMHFI